MLVASGGFFGPPIGDAVEIGYSVVPEHRGHGIATELIVALTERALGAPGVRCVVAHTAEVNVASQKALRHAGFERLGAGPEAGTLRFERRALPPNESRT